jgi:hypothetical protein
MGETGHFLTYRNRNRLTVSRSNAVMHDAKRRVSFGSSNCRTTTT